MLYFFAIKEEEWATTFRLTLNLIIHLSYREPGIHDRHSPLARHAGMPSLLTLIISWFVDNSIKKRLQIPYIQISPEYKFISHA